MESAGMTANAIGGFLTAALCLTGIIVWWPGLGNWRRALVIYANAGWKRFVFDLHGAVGIWTFAVLLMWGLTGGYFVFPEPFRAVITLFTPIGAPGALARRRPLTLGAKILRGFSQAHYCLLYTSLEYQLGTLGDGREFRVQLTSPHQAPVGPTPRTADGKPDFSGVWFAQRTVDAGKPEPLPWAEALLRERAANNGKDAPGAHCLPRGITNAGALFPFKLVQTPALLVMLFEDDLPSHRQVFLDGRGHPQDPNPMWMGHSIGRWEGDTLVIDSVGFDNRSWLDTLGHPHTEMMHVIERFRRPDLGHLEIEFTIDDPGAYAKPWKITRASELDAGDDIGEYVCTENEKDVGHMVGR